MLIKNAWDEILESKVHRIKKTDLRGLHKSNDNLNETIHRLHTSFVNFEAIYKGELSDICINLIDFSANNKKDDGYLYYHFNEYMRSVLREAQYFTRLENQILKEIDSKYGLILYEIIAKRENMRYRKHRYTIEAMKDLLGVEQKSYNSITDFKKYVLDKAVHEVNKHSRFEVKYEAAKTGRKYTHIVLEWKTLKESKKCKQADDYGDYGIPARIFKLRKKREKEFKFTVPQKTINQIGHEGTGLDLYQMEEEFYYMNYDTEPADIAKAFRGFIRFRKQQIGV